MVWQAVTCLSLCYLIFIPAWDLQEELPLRMTPSLSVGTAEMGEGLQRLEPEDVTLGNFKSSQGGI